MFGRLRELFAPRAKPYELVNGADRGTTMRRKAGAPEEQERLRGDDEARTLVTQRNWRSFAVLGILAFLSLALWAAMRAPDEAMTPRASRKDPRPPVPPAPAKDAVPSKTEAPDAEALKRPYKLPPVPNYQTWPILYEKSQPSIRVPPAIPRGRCPSKQFADYARFHSDILSGNFSSLAKMPTAEERRPKFIVYTCRPHIAGEQDPCGGLADRIVGIMSTVMFGMLSNRVVLVEFQREVKATDVFLPVSINWGVSLPDFLKRHGLNATGDYRERWVDLHNPSNHTVDRLIEEKWEDWWHEEVIRVEINRGLTFLMTNTSSVYGPILRNWGWQPESAFACLMEYTLTPVPRIAEKINKMLPAVMDPRFFVIGIQIRTGDLKTFGKFGDQNNVTNFPGFFVCAENLADRKSKGKPVKIFLVSDSMHLKKDARTKYGDALIVTDAVPKHLGIMNELEAFKEFPFGIKPTEEDKQRLEKLKESGAKSQFNELEAYEGAILDLWTLTFTPYKIVSIRSGFGNVAALRRFWKDPKTVIRSKMGWQGSACGWNFMFNDYADLATHWYGRLRTC